MLKRRQSSISDLEVQSFLAVRLCMHWIFFLLANAIGVVAWMRLFALPTASWDEIQSQFLTSFLPILIVSIALFPVFILDSVRLSNRFTGPVFRLKKVLTSLAKGNQEAPIEFRENDFWKSLANDFNKVVALARAESATDKARS